MGWQDRAYASEDDYRGQMGGGPGGGGGFGLGGRLGSRSVVTWLLVANAVFFLLDSVFTGSQRAYWLSLSYWGNFNIDQGIYGLQLWRWVTYQFLHGDFLHILVNMIGLFFFGPLMEQWWGSRRFLAFYLLCGCCGAFLFTFFALVLPGVVFNVQALAADDLTPEMIRLVGASGSVYGILLACAVLYPKMRVMLLIPPIPMPMWVLATVFLGIAFLSLVAGSANAGGEAAHLGGAALAYLLIKKPMLLNWADRFSPAAIQEGWSRGRWERKQQQAAATEAEVDRILDKVKQHGLQSLTRKEKKTLQRATQQRRGG